METVNAGVERGESVGWAGEQDTVREPRPSIRSKSNDQDRIANALGWFSIGLGAAQVVAPGAVARLIGVEDEHRGLMRLLGMREIASGVGILSQPKPAGWLWSRVAGDVMDLALLGSAMGSASAKRTRVAAATAAVVGVAAADVFASMQRTKREGIRGSGDDTIRMKAAVTVNRDPDEVYELWRDYNNLARVMSHLESVEETSPGRSHWRAKAPAGVRIEWDAETVADEPNELIAWRSLPGADLDNSGAVRFTKAPGDRGTEIRVEMRYEPPGGVVGGAIAKVLNAVPKTQLLNDLRRFKQVLETGEVVKSDASIVSGPHAARPDPRARAD